MTIEIDVDTRIDLLRRQVEELLEYHNELVKQGKIPAIRLMTRHNHYSANPLPCKERGQPANIH